MDDLPPRPAAASSHHAPTGAVPSTVHLPQCRLAVLKGPQRGREFVLTNDVIRIGKANDNDVVLPEETVSRVHLEILRDAKGYLVRDLHSTNGTFLDGAEIREAYIRPGSQLTVGTVQLRFQASEERVEVHASTAEEFGDAYGRAQAMREIFGLLEKLASTDATLLFEGEPGTGKELLARAVHARSRRRAAPLVMVDCGGLAPDALEGALFGHEKGAFPGAATTRQGSFELAHGGTIYLSRVEEMATELQPKLLRVLEQREVRRIGSARPIKIDLRFIASAERDLRREVERGKLREDLYFRLAAVPVRVPPLRERRDDIPGLVERILAAARGREAPERSPASVTGGGTHGGGAGAAGATTLGANVQVATLVAHDWPGNVAELKAVVERGLGLGATVASSIDPATGLDGAAGLVAGAGGAAAAFDPARSYREEKDRWEREFERRYLTWLLARADGNISRAARDADMDRKYLHKLLKKHDLVGS